MSMRTPCVCLAVALLVVAGGVSAAQTPPATQPPGTPPATQPPAATPVQPAQPGQPAPGAATAYRAKDVLGSKVMLQGNATAGTVEDIVFSDAGDIEYLIVNNNNMLTTVPWAAAKWNLQQRTATVNITPEQFRTVPTFTVQTYPEFFAPTYRNQVYKVYGLTPREIRRIERRDR
jgi:hypothetical protein